MRKHYLFAGGEITIKIKIIPNVDLAEISFESSDIFSIGTLGNSEYADD
ncbi:hypothetical protein [Chamaesiphon sp. OTE_75_metabat_556]|nr:hypothetical protein [Chamaesiphon sp. OTE_75_metabat_556]